ncbi:hypothetical protein WAI453_007023 [Rhynchosporium graminicola]
MGPDCFTEIGEVLKCVYLIYVYDTQDIRDEDVVGERGIRSYFLHCRKAERLIYLEESKRLCQAKILDAFQWKSRNGAWSRF